MQSSPTQRSLAHLEKANRLRQLAQFYLRRGNAHVAAARERQADGYIRKAHFWQNRQWRELLRGTE